MTMSLWRRKGFPLLWNWQKSCFAALFAEAEMPWDVLHELDRYLDMLLASSGTEIRSPVPQGAHIEGRVFVDEGCRIESGAFIRGPAWIGAGCEIRAHCYIRGGVLAAPGALLGHASEFKQCILMEGAQAPHFNYIGDSVMGIHSHVGAGVILSNYRLDGKAVRVRLPGHVPLQKEHGANDVQWPTPAQPFSIETGLAKFGALLGDYCEIGCNSVLNPGTILGESSVVMPLTEVRGTWPAESRLSRSGSSPSGGCPSP